MGSSMTDASAELCLHISSHLELWCLYLKEAEVSSLMQVLDTIAKHAGGRANDDV
jgi:hypothetical protein